METKIKVKVGSKGLLIPKKLLKGVKEAQISKEENDNIVVTPIKIDDPIWKFGSDPIRDDITDGSVNHDKYLY